MNAIHGDCELLRELEADDRLREVKWQAPLCCQTCPELFAITSYMLPGCRVSGEGIDIRDTHCETLIRYRLDKLAYDLDNFARGIVEKITDLQDAIKRFISEVEES